MAAPTAVASSIPRPRNGTTLTSPVVFTLLLNRASQSSDGEASSVRLAAPQLVARGAGSRGSGAGAPPKSSSWATLAAWRDRRIGGSSGLSPHPQPPPSISSS